MHCATCKIFTYSSLFPFFFFYAGIPVSAGKKRRHIIVANENAAETIVHLSPVRKDDIDETVDSNKSVEF